MVIILLIDLYFIVWFTFNIIKAIIGEGPLGKILSILGSIASVFLFYKLLTGTSDIISSIALYGPIAILMLLLFLSYIFNWNKT